MKISPLVKALLLLLCTRAWRGAVSQPGAVQPKGLVAGISVICAGSWQGDLIQKGQTSEINVIWGVEGAGRGHT